MLTIKLPDDYRCGGRLAHKSGKPGVWATSPAGKELFIMATQDKYAKLRKSGK